ncbi:MAG: tetratricopeptide repeat protein [Vicinamibacteria bacterium]
MIPGNPMRRGIATTALTLLLAPAALHAQQSPVPVDGETRFNNGLEHLRGGRLDMALEEFKGAVKQDPKNPYFFKGLGVAYAQLADRCPAKDQSCRQRNLEEAVLAARKAIELNPYYADARNDLGTYLIRSGKREEGKKEFLAAFGDPTNPSPEFAAGNLGQAFFEEKNYSQAANWFQTSLGKNKLHALAYLGLSDTLLAMGRVDEAIVQLEAGAKALPENWDIALSLGDAYYRAGRFGEARTRLELVAGKDPSGAAGRRASELLKRFPK